MRNDYATLTNYCSNAKTTNCSYGNINSYMSVEGYKLVVNPDFKEDDYVDKDVNTKEKMSWIAVL